MSHNDVLEIPEQRDIDVSPQREPQAGSRPWPPGTVIVSADSHLIEQDYWDEGIQAIFDATTVDNAQRIVGRTALELFDMH
ncbi:MAG: hypothetical protein ACODAC_04250 [Pseudomonadota bacterium]